MMLSRFSQMFVGLNAKKIVRKVSDCYDHVEVKASPQYKRRFSVAYLTMIALIAGSFFLHSMVYYNISEDVDFHPSALRYEAPLQIKQSISLSYEKIISVVNMPEREVRWLRTKDMVYQVPSFKRATVTRIEAVVGRELDLAQLYETSVITEYAYRSLISTRNVTGIYLTPGGLGCFLSHVTIWKKTIELNQPMIVFEDDVYFVDKFDEKFQQILNELPSDFGLFYFADFVKSRNTRGFSFSQSLDRINGEQWGTYAYMISPETAKLLYQNVFPIENQVDSFMTRMRQKYKIPTYRSKQNLVETDHDDGRASDVQVTRQLEDQKTIPSVVYVSDQLSQFNNFHPSQLVGNFNIDKWDDARLAQEEHMDLVEGDDASIDVLPVQLSILYDHGGLFIKSELRIHHPLEYFLQGISGFIAYDKMENGTVTYPLIGMHAGETSTIALMEKLSQTNVDEMYDVIRQMTSRIPKENEILLLPIDVLHNTGF